VPQADSRYRESPLRVPTVTPLTVAVAASSHGPRAVRVVGTMGSLFTTMGIEVASGRHFADGDTASRVVLLSRAATRALARAPAWSDGSRAAMAPRGRSARQ
jgi:hypothetical protein